MFFKKPIINIADKMPLALLIIDMQEYFFEGYKKAGKYRRIKKLIKNQIKLIELADKNKIPVIFIEHRFNKPMMRHQYKVEFEERQPTIKDLLDKARNSYLIERNHDNGFYHTYMDECSGLTPLLIELEIKGIIFSGINAGSCVYCTADTAAYKKFSILTADDIIADYRDFFPIRRYYAEGDFESVYFNDCDHLVRSIEAGLKCS